MNEWKSTPYLENGEKWGEVDLKGSLDLVLGFPRIWEKSRDTGFSNSSTPESSQESGGRQGGGGMGKKSLMLSYSQVN